MQARQNRSELSSFSSVVNTVRKRYELRHLPPPVILEGCDRCLQTGVVSYSIFTGDVYCTCPKGLDLAADEARAVAMIRAERAAALAEGISRRLSAFSKMHFLDGQVPSLKRLEPTEATMKISSFAEHWNGRRSLCLGGLVGRGKTQIILGLVNDLMPQLLERGQTVRIITVPDLLNELRAGFDEDHQKVKEGYDDMLEAYRSCGLLVLDDLGAEKLTAWVKEQFYLLFDHRYRQQLPIFSTTNCTYLELRARLGYPDDQRVWDRMRQTTDFLNVEGPNHRDAYKQGGE